MAVLLSSHRRSTALDRNGSYPISTAETKNPAQEAFRLRFATYQAARTVTESFDESLPEQGYLSFSVNYCGIPPPQIREYYTFSGLMSTNLLQLRTGIIQALILSVVKVRPSNSLPNLAAVMLGYRAIIQPL
jgi:hypothetical protein